MGITGTRDDVKSTSELPAGRRGGSVHRHRGARRRRVLGLLGSALLVLVMSVSFLLPESVTAFGRSIAALFSSPAAPAAQEPTPPAVDQQPAAVSTDEAMDELAAAAPVFGLYTPDSPTDQAEISAAESAVGVDAGIVAYFADASHPLDVGLLDDAASDGAIPMLSLETTGWATADIAAGRYDEQIRTLANKLGQFNDGEGGVVLVRLNHEMNGHWYPWSEAAAGNAPGDYAAAWKRIVDIVRGTGTGSTTVLWVWSPNILRGAEFDTMVAAYPGDDYVDYIGLTGYGNTTYERTAGQTFDATIAAIRTEITADKPLIITESGASPGKYQTAWTQSLGPWLEANDEVQAFVWFNFDPADGATSDWRFTTEPAVADALRESLAEAGATPLAAAR